MGNGTFIIAEAGIAHRGSRKQALEMVDAAAMAGADAIKFQSYSATRLVNRKAAKEMFETLYEAQLTEVDLMCIAAQCQARGITFMSTPFDVYWADALMRVDVPIFKIASGSLTDEALIGHVAKFGKPMFISTGMGSMTEIERAYKVARASGAPEVTMLQCTTAYPTPYEDANLLAMKYMNRVIGCRVGYSDHTVGPYCCFAAATLGASVIEKHFMLKGQKTPDSACSLLPEQLTDMVRGIRAIEKSLGREQKALRVVESDNYTMARMGLYWVYDLTAGDKVTEKSVAWQRPATGAKIKIEDIIGRELAKAVKSGDPVKGSDLCS